MQVLSPNFRLILYGTCIAVLFLDILYLAIKIMLFYAFMSYLHYLCLLAYSGVQHILCCVFLLPFSSSCVLCMMASTSYCIVFLGLFVFVLCLVYPILPVSLDCPFLISPSVPLTIFYEIMESCVL